MVMRRWARYEVSVDNRLVEITRDWTFALSLYRLASRQVPAQHAAVRLVGSRGAAQRILVRKPRWPAAPRRSPALEGGPPPP
jgi:hypothetical protein